MLTLSRRVAVLLLLGVLSTIAPPTFAVEGAFGLRFDTAIKEEQLGATTAPGLFLSLLGDQPNLLVQLAVPAWHAFLPKALPQRLNKLRSEMQVQIADDGKPAWIAAGFSMQDCPAELRWLRDVLRKKYQQPDLSIKPAATALVTSSNFSERLQFEFHEVVVAAGCTLGSAGNSKLQIEYWHRPSADALFAIKQRNDEAANLAAMQQKQAAAALGKLRGRAVASTVASGSRYNIDQVFGLPMDQAVKEPGNFEADEYIDYPLQGVAPPYRGQTARVQLGPAGHLIRFELSISDPQAAEFKRLRIALEQQFAQPTKATNKHIIFRVGEDHIVLRRRLQQLEFTLISGAGEKGLKSRQLAAQEAIWEAENAGI